MNNHVCNAHKIVHAKQCQNIDGEHIDGRRFEIGCYNLNENLFVFTFNIFICLYV